MATDFSRADLLLFAAAFVVALIAWIAMIRSHRAQVRTLERAIEDANATIARRHAEHQEHRAAMVEIVDAFGEGLLVLNAEGRVVTANRRAAEMFGAVGDLAGRPAVEIVRKQPALVAIDKALHGSASSERMTFGLDDERVLEVRTLPVAAASEIAAIALFIDVTAIERLERIRRDFLDDFSHEVRTPLAGLRSAIETLEAGSLDADAEKQLRGVIDRQSARIERLVKDLSELNQIESGKIAIQPQPVHIQQMLRELADDLVDRARFHLHGDDLIVPLDQRAQQIFANLLDNACKHGRGGEIEIDVKRETGHAVVRISDRGPGIPPAELGRIFNRFYRVDRSRSQSGSGLGLAITKHLVALHGGTIRAYNRAGGGATFEVRLPLHAA